MQTQTYVENVAISTMVDMEEGLTKTVTLTPQEAATITKEQLAKIQVCMVFKLQNILFVWFAKHFVNRYLEISKFDVMI